MHNYSSTLRSLTQGKAKFSMKFLEYAPVTPDVQQKLSQEWAAHHKDHHDE